MDFWHAIIFTNEFYISSIWYDRILSVEFWHAIIFIKVQKLRFRNWSLWGLEIYHLYPISLLGFLKIFKGRFLERFIDYFQRPDSYWGLNPRAIHSEKDVLLKTWSIYQVHFVFLLALNLVAKLKITFSGSFSLIRCCQLFSVENIFCFQPTASTNSKLD